MPKRKLGRFRQEVDDGIRARQIRKLAPRHKIVTSSEVFKARTLTAPIMLRDLPAAQSAHRGQIDEVDELADRFAALTLDRSDNLLSQKACSSTDTDCIKPLASFTCFVLLPPELRLKIWKFARPGPRIVRLAFSQWDEEDSSKNFYSSAPIPAMLHACFESRQIALKWYQLSFHLAHHYPRSECHAAHTYFDFSRDYFYVGCEQCNAFYCENCYDILSIESLNDIKRLLVRWPSVDKTPLFLIANWYPNVEEVLLMGWRQHVLRAGTRFEELKEAERPFEWQQGKSMEETMLEEKKRILSIEIDCMLGFNPAKIAHVEVVGSIEKEEEL